jgi:hypothetical protein
MYCGGVILKLFLNYFGCLMASCPSLIIAVPRLRNPTPGFMTMRGGNLHGAYDADETALYLGNFAIVLSGSVLAGFSLRDFASCQRTGYPSASGKELLPGIFPLEEGQLPGGDGQESWGGSRARRKANRMRTAGVEAVLDPNEGCREISGGGPGPKGA